MPPVFDETSAHHPHAQRAGKQPHSNDTTLESGPVSLGFWKEWRNPTSRPVDRATSAV